MSGKKGAYRPPQARTQAWKPTGALRREAVTSMRSLASEIEHHHPRMGAHQHLKDAANALERNHADGAARHLNAAIANFQPQSLYRHGMVTDADYHQAKAHMDAVHRHLLLVRDIQDHDAHNQGLSALSAQPEEDDPTQGYGPAANAQKPTARGDHAAMTGPKKLPTGGPDPSVAQPKSTTNWHITKQIAASNGDLTTGFAIELAGGNNCYRCSTPNAPDAMHCKRCGFDIVPSQPYDRFASEDITCPYCGRGDDSDAVFCDQCGKRIPAYASFSNVDLSAETARLAVTPAPRGRPGGPGLYRVKGMGHTPYLQQVVKALIEKRGMPPGKAYAIARASIRKWSVKSKHPEVRAAAGSAEAGELARQARAHAHSNTYQGVIALGWEDELRGSHGEWVKALGGLADKLDSDHPGAGLGAHVREARDAVQRGDIAHAGEKLQDAKTALRDRKFYTGGRGDATYRHAIGNSSLLEGHIRHANAVFDTAQQDAQPAKKHKFFATEESMSTIDLVGAGGWSHGFKRAGDPGFDPTPHKGGHRSTRASAIKKGDRLMGSYEGDRAGFGAHRVMSVEHHGSGAKHRVTIRVMDERSGKVHRQTLRAHQQVEHAKPGYNTGEGGRLSPAEHVQRLHDLADQAERAAMTRNIDPNLGSAARPLYGATDDTEGYASFQRRGGSSTAASLRSAARAVGNGDFDRARRHMEEASRSARTEMRHGSDTRIADAINRHAATLGSLPSGNRGSGGRIDTSEAANRAREEAARAYAARTGPQRRGTMTPSSAPRSISRGGTAATPLPRTAPTANRPRTSSSDQELLRRAQATMLGKNIREAAARGASAGEIGSIVQRAGRSGETRAQAARRTSANRRRNAGLSNWDAVDRAIELAVLAPKG